MAKVIIGKFLSTAEYDFVMQNTFFLITFPLPSVQLWKYFLDLKNNKEYLENLGFKTHEQKGDLTKTDDQDF